jgi:predicted DNA-binding protein (MmcQ/YjbR family)
MNIDQIRNICLELQGVEESIKWEHNLCFTVGKKLFLIINPDNYPIDGSFKTSKDALEFFLEKEGFSPAPYLARYDWIYFDQLSRFRIDEWDLHIKKSYELVFEKLPTKLKKEILSE